SLGAVNSLQFTTMNTVTLKDLGPQQASSGNGLMSVVQMLAMSLGVAAAAALLSNFSATEAAQQDALHAFRATFVCVGIMTCASAALFWQLAPATPKTKAEEEPVELGSANGRRFSRLQAKRR